MTHPRIDRAKTAIARADLSRPLRLAIDSGCLTPEKTVFDYGCGRGIDLALLSESGYQASGWDPNHLASAPKQPADVVNIGYVVNVIENGRERAEALNAAWQLAGDTLVVSARLHHDARGLDGDAYRDGIVTKAGTFQKFFSQGELRSWIEGVLDEEPIAAAPGIFFVFRSPDSRSEYLRRRYRRRAAEPRLRKSDLLFEEHRELLEALMSFYRDRGRLPRNAEPPGGPEIETAFGSVRRAFQVIRRVTGPEEWNDIRSVRRDELALRLALERFGRRPKFGARPSAERWDIKDLYSSYTKACDVADNLLFSVGDQELVSQHCRESPLGKLTGNALYVHIDYVSELSVPLRVYEGCARAYIGDVEDATVAKLHRQKPKVSYLTYPDFDTDPHPVLARGYVVKLGKLDIVPLDYSGMENPFVLHRKEELLPQHDPRREEFAALTLEEESLGLLEDSATIGRLEEWTARLNAAGVTLEGHHVRR